MDLNLLNEEDRISELPDDIILCILSFLDLKYVIRTCTLSKRWNLIWTLIPRLNLNMYLYQSRFQFIKFFKRMLSRRNKQQARVTAVDLTFEGRPTRAAVKTIHNYTYYHRIQQLTIKWFAGFGPLPKCLFRSCTVKHLTLEAKSYPFLLEHEAWDFPVLETLYLSNIMFVKPVKILDPFSKCYNLKSLTLHDCWLRSVDTFHVSAPQLSHLSILDAGGFPKLVNVVAQLQNFTLSTNSDFINYKDISIGFIEGLDSVENADLSLLCPSPPFYLLVHLLHKLRSAKVVILNTQIIEDLSSCMYQLGRGPCAFTNLKCVKIKTLPLSQNYKPVAEIPTGVRNYFIGNSPSATFILDLPAKDRFFDHNNS